MWVSVVTMLEVAQAGHGVILESAAQNPGQEAGVWGSARAGFNTPKPDPVSSDPKLMSPTPPGVTGTSLARALRLPGAPFEPPHNRGPESGMV